MAPLGDRRRYLRLEVMGALWGVVDDDRFVRIVNISTNGALVSSPGPFELDAIETMQLRLEGQEIRIRCVVRHVEPAPEREPPPPRQYRIGLEFVEPAAALTAALAAREHIRTGVVGQKSREY